VKAITPQGKIVTAECFQCLDCQVEYYDDRRCPPLAKQRKQREILVGRPTVSVPAAAFVKPVTPSAAEARGVAASAGGSASVR
jgi:hypothetical protein